MNVAHVVHDAVEFEDDGQPEAAHGGYGIVADAHGLQDGHAEHEAKHEVRIILDELAHRPPSGTGEPEILAPPHHAVDDAQHEVGHNHDDDEDQHPAQLEDHALDLPDEGVSPGNGQLRGYGVQQLLHHSRTMCASLHFFPYQPATMPAMKAPVLTILAQKGTNW